MKSRWTLALAASLLLVQTGCGLSATIFAVWDNNGSDKGSGANAPNVLSVAPAAGSHEGGVIVTVTI